LYKPGTTSTGPELHPILKAERDDKTLGREERKKARKEIRRQERETGRHDRRQENRRRG
jgi:hypothetical protein